ncbi:MAG: 3',5'-cyclic-nucleotide phosphodiesterase [Nitrospirae bacterium]|nr:3',5'-cyclic-nucleotide phosphodiesterase [Nitrospirota bacterium]
MKIRVLGCSGAKFPDTNMTGFLIDEKILFDAGTIGAVLSETEQFKIRYILLTHAHLDHIIGIPFLLDNIVVRKKRHHVTVMGIKETLRDLKKHLLNDRLWPDFTKIPDKTSPVLLLNEIKHGVPFNIGGYRIFPLKVSHPVPAAGYIIEKGGKRLIFTGDTGPTDKTWNEVNSVMRDMVRACIDAIIIEVSFPNSMEEFAIKCGHLTPGLLFRELKQLNNLPKKIFITHPKKQYYKTIKDEIKKLRMPEIEMLSDGMVIEI